MAEIRCGYSEMDFVRVQTWLAQTYWSPGVSRADVERAAQNSSLVIGAFVDGVQVGYARVISDRTSFGYLADVVVDEAYRGRGIGRAMVRHALRHPEHRGFRKWVLATRSAHGVYAACGFGPLESPEHWMIHRPEG